MYAVLMVGKLQCVARKLQVMSRDIHVLTILTDCVPVGSLSIHINKRHKDTA